MSTVATRQHFTPDRVRTAAARVTINIALRTDGGPTTYPAWRRASGSARLDAAQSWLRHIGFQTHSSRLIGVSLPHIIAATPRKIS